MHFPNKDNLTLSMLFLLSKMDIVVMFKALLTTKRQSLEPLVWKLVENWVLCAQNIYFNFQMQISLIELQGWQLYP